MVDASSAREERASRHAVPGRRVGVQGARPFGENVTIMMIEPLFFPKLVVTKELPASFLETLIAVFVPVASAQDLPDGRWWPPSISSPRSSQRPRTAGLRLQRRISNTCNRLGVGTTCGRWTSTAVGRQISDLNTG
jgi:hypothetical protein